MSARGEFSSNKSPPTCKNIIKLFIRKKLKSLIPNKTKSAFFLTAFSSNS